MTQVLGTCMERVKGVVAQSELVQKVIAELSLKQDDVFHEFTISLDTLLHHLI